jgi:hypothetical protein
MAILGQNEDFACRVMVTQITVLVEQILTGHKVFLFSQEVMIKSQVLVVTPLTAYTTSLIADRPYTIGPFSQIAGILPNTGVSRDFLLENSHDACVRPYMGKPTRGRRVSVPMTNLFSI